MVDFLNRLIESSLLDQSPDYRRRSRILVGASVGIMLFNIFAFALLSQFLNEVVLARATLVTFLVGLPVLPVLRFTGSVTFAGNILLCQTWGLVHVLSFYTEIGRSVPPAWIIFIPVLAIHVCNRASSLVWTLLATAEILLVAWHTLDAQVMDTASLLLYLGTHLGLLALLVATAYFNERFKERTLNRLSLANKELHSARDRVLEASRAKSTFVANMSHELRTPLNAVIGYADMLAEDADSESSQLKKDLGRIKSSGQHLLRLINELLEFSRLESGVQSLNLEPFGLGYLLRELIQNMEPEAKKNSNSLKLLLPDSDDDLEIQSDPTKLRQCIYNLLSNACKFTSEGEITLSLELVESKIAAEKETFLVVVEDTGIGMTPEQLERVFEPFVQAEESIARRFGGTGLGLSLSRRLAESLGGSLEGFSEDGRGSRFVLTLPKKPASS